MRRKSPFAALGIALLALAPAPAPADVVDVGENGFTIRETAAVSADAARAWDGGRGRRQVVGPGAHVLARLGQPVARRRGPGDAGARSCRARPASRT